MKTKYIPKLILFFLVFSTISCGCNQKPIDRTHESDSLRLTVTVDENAEFQNFAKEDLGGNFDGDFSYYQLSDVSIQVDGENLPLEDAIRNGHVSVETLIAQAMKDARLGTCVFNHNTTLGLTSFCYSYPEGYDLVICYDVFIASDGTEFLYNRFYVTKLGEGKNISPGFAHKNDDGTYTSYNYEDWNLTFSVKDVTTTSLVLEYCQGEHSMQTGELSLQHFLIDTEDHAISPPEAIQDMQNIAKIESKGCGQIPLDWAELYGPLSPGDYQLVVYIYDQFDKENTHPLLQNYINGQYYWIDFSIS